MAKILIVDENNEEVGTAEMSDAHKNGLIHRIVQIFLFNSKDELFLQQRSHTMLGYPGLWDQSAGGHVDAGETNIEAAKRETEEEIGLKNAALNEIGTYYDDSGVNVAGQKLRRFYILYSVTSDEPVVLDTDEVEAGRWVSLQELEQLIATTPADYTPGLVNALNFYNQSG